MDNDRKPPSLDFNLKILISVHILASLLFLSVLTLPPSPTCQLPLPTSFLNTFFSFISFINSTSLLLPIPLDEPKEEEHRLKRFFFVFYLLKLILTLLISVNFFLIINLIKSSCYNCMCNKQLVWT